MKKKLIILLSTCLVTTLVGCNNKVPNDKDMEDTLIVDRYEFEDEITDINNKLTDERICRLYYFNTTTLELYYVDKEVEEYENYDELVEILTNELQTYSPNNTFLNLTDKVELVSSSLDLKEGLLKIVFSASYIDEMTLGSATESGLLSSLLATYGHNLGVDKVSIYFGDELYTSLRGELPEGYFNVSHKEAREYKEEEFKLDIDENEEEIDEDMLVHTDIYSQRCRIYYYNGNEDEYYYEDKDVEVYKKALVTGLTNEIKNTPNKEFFDFEDDLVVKSAKLDGDTIIVDLEKSYYDILRRVGSSSEVGALRSLALTYGYNYNVDKVIILIDGKPYEGSHIVYEANEVIDISKTNAKELK